MSLRWETLTEKEKMTEQDEVALLSRLYLADDEEIATWSVSHVLSPNSP